MISVRFVLLKLPDENELFGRCGLELVVLDAVNIEVSGLILDLIADNEVPISLLLGNVARRSCSAFVITDPRFLYTPPIPDRSEFMLSRSCSRSRFKNPASSVELLGLDMLTTLPPRVPARL